MSQQGGKPSGHEDDWWGQLYDDTTEDTGPTATPDSLDDRFASAAGTVEGGGASRADTEGGVPAPRPAPAGVAAGGVSAPRSGDVDVPDGEASAPRADGVGAVEVPGRPESGRPDSGGQRAPWEPPPDSPPGPATFPPGPNRPGFAEQPPPWGRTAPEQPPSRGRAAVEQPTPPGRTAAATGGRTSTETPTTTVPASRTPPGTPPPPSAPPPPPPPFGPPPPAVPPAVPPARGDTEADARGVDDERDGLPDGSAREGAVADPPAGAERERAPWEPPPATESAPPQDAPLASSAADPPTAAHAGNAGPGTSPEGTPPSPRTPTRVDLPVPSLKPVDHVGSGPPTYEAEPTALPPADPDDLDDLVADTVLDGARYGASTLRAASVRGDSARFRGEPRRDSLLTARFGTGEHALVLVAMATGARATPGAHRAAAEACHWIGRAVGRSHARLAEDMRAGRRGDLKSGLHRLTDRSLGKLRASAAEQGIEPEEYAAALRCLLLPADPECRTRVFFGVGAGGLFRLRDGEWQDIEPRVFDVPGEPVVGFGSLPAETPEGDRLTMDLGIPTPPSPYEPAPEPPREPFRFRASVARPGDTLLMCTGGLAEPLRGEPELCGYLTGRWSGPAAPGLAEFLADTQVRVKGYADDRTAAAVWEA